MQHIRDVCVKALVITAATVELSRYSLPVAGGSRPNIQAKCDSRELAKENAHRHLQIMGCHDMLQISHSHARQRSLAIGHEKLKRVSQNAKALMGQVGKDTRQYLQQMLIL